MKIPAGNFELCPRPLIHLEPQLVRPDWQQQRRPTAVPAKKASNAAPTTKTAAAKPVATFKPFKPELNKTSPLAHVAEHAGVGPR